MLHRLIKFLKIHEYWSSHHGSVEMNLTSICEDGLMILNELMIQRCHELGYRSQMEPGSNIAVAVVEASGYISNLTLAWEPPYAMVRP